MGAPWTGTRVDTTAIWRADSPRSRPRARTWVVCPHCHKPIRRGRGATIRRPYRFGLCLVSLHRSGRSAIGDEVVAAIVHQPEEQVAHRLGVIMETIGPPI